MDDKTSALLQDAAFGDGTPDPEALARVLAESADAREGLAQFEALAEALRAEGPVDPPADFGRSVMQAVNGGRSRHEVPGGTGEAMNKKWIVGIAAAVAAAIGIYVAAGGSIPPRGVEGTIGAAKRYQGQQISTADVQLGDQALQKFLQSTTFDKIRRDPALRKSFIKVVSSPAFAKVANDPSFAALASSDAFLALTSDAALKQLATDADLKLLGVKQLATDAELKQLGVKQLANDAELKQLGVKQLATDADLKQLGVKQLATDAELKQLGVKQLATDAALKQLANDANFKQLAGDAALKQLLIDADFVRLMQDASFAKFLQDANLKLLLNDANLKQLTNDAALAQLANDAGLAGAAAGRKAGGGQQDYVP